MPKNKNNFFETNIIIPKINKKWNSKRKKSHEIVHLIVDISCLVVKCAFQIRFNPNLLNRGNYAIAIAKNEFYDIIM